MLAKLFRSRLNRWLNESGISRQLFAAQIRKPVENSRG
jgi:hypothetical protein